MFGIGSTGVLDGVFLDELSECIVILILAAIGMTPLIRTMFFKFKQKGLEWFEQIFIFFIFLLSIIQVVSLTYSPFIYFNF